MGFIFDNFSDNQSSGLVDEPDSSFNLEDEYQQIIGQERQLQLQNAPTESTVNPFARGWHNMSTAIEETGNIVSGDFESAAQNYQTNVEWQQAHPKTRNEQELGIAWEEGEGFFGGVGNVLSEIKKGYDQSAGLTAGLSSVVEDVVDLGKGVVEQIPNMVAPMAGMILGGLSGAAAGSYVPVLGTTVGGFTGSFAGGTVGNTLLEGGFHFEKALQEAGISPYDEKGIVDFLNENSGELLKQAGIKGSVLSAVDLLTLKLGHGLLTAPVEKATQRALKRMGVDIADKKAVKAAMSTRGDEISFHLNNDAVLKAATTQTQKVARNVAAALTEPAGEFTGEFLGEGLASGHWNVKEAGLEALASMGTSAITFTGQKGFQYATNPIKNLRNKEPQNADELLEKKRQEVADAKVELEKTETGLPGFTQQPAQQPAQPVQQQPVSEEEQQAPPTKDELDRRIGLVEKNIQMLESQPNPPQQRLEMAKQGLAALHAQRQEMERTSVVIDAKAAETANSPTNDRPVATNGQALAGNYKKGSLDAKDTTLGMPISIENDKGSVRTNKDPDAKPFSVEMKNHYGYIKGTTGFDKDHLDVFIGPEAATTDKVFVIDQVDPETGAFDEHKIMHGFSSAEEAQQAYLDNYEPGWQGFGSVTEMSVDAFKEWSTGQGPQQGALSNSIRTPDTVEVSFPGEEIQTMKRTKALDKTDTLMSKLQRVLDCVRS